MANTRGIAAEVAVLALQVVGAAAFIAAVIVYTWDSTRSAVRTLLVAIVGTTLVRIAYTRYRIRRSKERRDRYALPFVQYHGGTDI